MRELSPLRRAASASWRMALSALSRLVGATSYEKRARYMGFSVVVFLLSNQLHHLLVRSTVATKLLTDRPNVHISQVAATRFVARRRQAISFGMWAPRRSCWRLLILSCGLPGAI